MAVVPSEAKSSANKNLLSLSYSDFLRNRFLSPTNFLSNLTSLFRSSSRRECLPLPLLSPSIFIYSSRRRVPAVLEDVLERVLTNLHSIQKDLQFWQSIAEKSNNRKAYFMIFERGPRAFIGETVNLLRGRAGQSSSLQNLCQFASDYVYERVSILSSLRRSLAIFLAQIYVEVDKFGEELMKDPENKLPPLLVSINDLFSTFEASIGHLHAMRQSDLSVDGTYSTPLLFEKLPEINQEGSQWTDCELSDAINSVYQNLHKLESYICFLVVKHRKPKKITQHWVNYAFGAVGLSVCSLWLLRHSSLMGSSDHVEQPILSIRDVLFETSRKRHQDIMDLEEVRLTSNSLHRYEKESMHPIQNLRNGVLPLTMLIQALKLKLDTGIAMLELLAALPACFRSLLLIMVVPAWFKQDTKAEGRVRVARYQRWLLVKEVKRRIMQYQTYVDQGLESDANYMSGLILYSLDRLYRSVKRDAEAFGEGYCLQQDIIDLARPGVQTEHKLTVTSNLVGYDCFFPPLRPQ